MEMMPESGLFVNSDTHIRYERDKEGHLTEPGLNARKLIENIYNNECPEGVETKQPTDAIDQIGVRILQRDETLLVRHPSAAYLNASPLPISRRGREMVSVALHDRTAI